MAARVRLHADVQGTRPGVPRLPALRGVRGAACRRRGAAELLHDLGYARAAPGVPRTRIHVRANAAGCRGDRGRTRAVDGEDLLMDEPREEQHRPARPLVGYRDVGEGIRHSRRAVTRAWLILLVIAL